MLHVMAAEAMTRRNAALEPYQYSMPDYTDAVRAFSLSLRTMHRALVAAELSDPAVVAGTPFDQMQRLLHDPALAWLKPIFDLMVDLDGRLAMDTEIDTQEAQRVRRRAESLFGPSDPDRVHAVQRGMANLTHDHPPVTMALGDMRRALSKLPKPDGGN